MSVRVKSCNGVTVISKVSNQRWKCIKFNPLFFAGHNWVFWFFSYWDSNASSSIISFSPAIIELIIQVCLLLRFRCIKSISYFWLGIIDYFGFFSYWRSKFVCASIVMYLCLSCICLCVWLSVIKWKLVVRHLEKPKSLHLRPFQSN